MKREATGNQPVAFLVVAEPAVNTLAKALD
jgi:hypothetical protein